MHHHLNRAVKLRKYDASRFWIKYTYFIEWKRQVLSKIRHLKKPYKKVGLCKFICLECLKQVFEEETFLSNISEAGRSSMASEFYHENVNG